MLFLLFIYTMVMSTDNIDILKSAMLECYDTNGYNHLSVMQQNALELMRSTECINFIEKTLLLHDIKNDNRVESIKNRYKKDFYKPSMHFEKFIHNGSMSLWQVFYEDKSFGRTKMGLYLATSNQLFNFSHEYMKYAESDTSIFYGDTTLYELSKGDFSSRVLFTPSSQIHSLMYDKEEQMLYLGTIDELIKINTERPNERIYLKGVGKHPKPCQKVRGTNLLLVITDDGFYRVHTKTNEVIQVFTKDEYSFYSFLNNPQSCFSDSGNRIGTLDKEFNLKVYDFNDNLLTYVDPRLVFKSIFDNSNNQQNHYYASAIKFLPNNDAILFVSITHLLGSVTRHYISIFDCATPTTIIDIQVDYNIADFLPVDTCMWALSSVGNFYIIPYEALIGYSYLKQAGVTQTSHNPIFLDATHNNLKRSTELLC